MGCEMVRKRNQFIDFVKGSGMLLVIWAHCGLPWLDIINYFHMPLFFLLSGLFFTENMNWGTWLRKKVKGLYVPFAAYEVVFLLLRNLFLKMRLYTTEEWSWMYPLSSAGGVYQ